MSSKPRLRGLGQRQWAICLGLSLAAGASFALWFKVNVVERRKQHYIDFYKDYDDDKAYQSMKDAGIFKGFEAS